MIVTLGHSTHTPNEFVKICRTARVQVILDVRSHPTSHWPWWHGDEAARWLPENGIDYRPIPALGGWDVRHAPLQAWAERRGVKLSAYLRGFFPKQRIGVTPAAGTGSGWTNQGLHDYCWYTALNEFQDALAAVRAEYGGRDDVRAALVCSELLWWKCHRSMIADVLTYGGLPVFNLTPAPPLKRGPQAGQARVRCTPHDSATDRIRRYPAEVLAAWPPNNWATPSADVQPELSYHA